MSLLLLFNANSIGPVEGNLSVTEVDDVLASSTTLDLVSNFASTERNDVASVVGVIAVAASAEITDADDTLSVTATLAIATNLAVTEGHDVPAASSTVEIVGSLATVEQDDAIAAHGVIGIQGHLAATEVDDTHSASALTPIWYPRRGGDDERARYEQRQIEWREQLRRIVDKSWRIANGEIDRITFEPIPPPDYSAVIDELINQALTIDLARAEAFMAEQERFQEEEAIVALLLGA